MKTRFRIIAVACVVISGTLFHTLLPDADHNISTPENSNSVLPLTQEIIQPSEPEPTESDVVFIVRDTSAFRPSARAVYTAAVGEVAVRRFDRSKRIVFSNNSLPDLKNDSNTRSNIRRGIEYLQRARAAGNEDAAVARMMSDSRVRQMMDAYGLDEARAEALLRDYLRNDPNDPRRKIDPVVIKPY